MKGERSGRRRRRVAGAGLLLFTVSVTGFVTGSRRRRRRRSCSLVGVAVGVGHAGAPTPCPTTSWWRSSSTAAGPVAQANVDTTGKATGFGSLPYPGENAVTAPGLLTFATGVPVPGYPFYARADHPVTPSCRGEGPERHLHPEGHRRPGEGRPDRPSSYFGGREPGHPVQRRQHRRPRRRRASSP